jgi:hypothetical protein
VPVGGQRGVSLLTYSSVWLEYSHIVQSIWERMKLSEVRTVVIRGRMNLASWPHCHLEPCQGRSVLPLSIVCLSHLLYPPFRRSPPCIIPRLPARPPPRAYSLRSTRPLTHQPSTSSVPDSKQQVPRAINTPTPDSSMWHNKHSGMKDGEDCTRVFYLVY